MDIRTYLKNNILLFDGGMGTCWAQRNRDADFSCEMANLLRPDSIRGIHEAYLAAGAVAIKTNTFRLNAPALGGDHRLLREAIEAGWKLAVDAADAAVAGNTSKASKAAGSAAPAGAVNAAKAAEAAGSAAPAGTANAMEAANPVNKAETSVAAGNALKAAQAAGSAAPTCTADTVNVAEAAGSANAGNAGNAGSVANTPNALKPVGNAGSAAGREVYVFADIGPISLSGEERPLPYYQEIIEIFLDCGATHFLFETNSSAQDIPEAAALIKARVPDAFILVSFAVQPDGYTREGFRGSSLLNETAACPDIDGVGMNCVSGAYHMRQLLRETPLPDTIISAMPNAGYPIVAGNHTLYDGDPGYYAIQLNELADLGVKILGGCCGTTPEHISRAASELKRRSGKGYRRIQVVPQARSAEEKAGNEKKPARPNRLWEKLERGEKVFAIELDPPKNAELGKFMAGAWTLKDAGADAITIADCPIGRARMDSSLLACKLKREVGIDPIPHMTCRDRNLNATKSLLLGLNVEGVDNVLIVTGDPLPTAERDEVKAVFNFNSRKLARFVADLNETQLQHPFRVYGALNLNAHNFDIELRRAKEKAANGVSGFLTQPVLTEQALENLKLARAAMPDEKLLGGIIPVVSYRNACFMQSEIAGINVSDEIIAMYKDKSREESEALALKISVEIARQIAPYADGYYMMTPFLRVGLMTQIMEQVRESGNG